MCCEALSYSSWCYSIYLNMCCSLPQCLIIMIMIVISSLPYTFLPSIFFHLLPWVDWPFKTIYYIYKCSRKQRDYMHCNYISQKLVSNELHLESNLITLCQIIFREPPLYLKVSHCQVMSLERSFKGKCSFWVVCCWSRWYYERLGLLGGSCSRCLNMCCVRAPGQSLRQRIRLHMLHEYESH